MDEYSSARSSASKLRKEHLFITNTYVYAKDQEEGGGYYFLALVADDHDVDLVPRFWDGCEVRTRMKGVVINVELKQEQLDKLQQISKKRGVTESYVLRELIDELG
jgi:hypothetical protein